MRFTNKPICVELVTTYHKDIHQDRNHYILCYDKECSMSHAYSKRHNIKYSSYRLWLDIMSVNRYSLYINEDGHEQLAHIVDCPFSDCDVDHYDLCHNRSIYV